MIHNINKFIAALALLATAQGAWADTETVSYIDADGNEQTATATVLTGDVTADGLSTDAWGAILIPAGWYVVKNSKDGVDASYTAQLCYTGDNGTIHLILADGAEMTVSKSTTHAIYLDHGYPLAIYGQSGGTGRLTVTGKSNAIEAQGGITINGGIVNVTETGTGSNHHAIYVMNGITINGGQVTATTAGSGKGIYVYSAALTIGCRKASDFVSFNSYYGTVNIKSGQTLYNGATAYSGDNVDVPTGTVTLRPYSSDDFSVNDAGTEYTIKSAGGWNVFCDLLADNTMGYFSGKTVQLGADITVTRMAGGQPFTGTFDGGGHTLTLAYGTADAPIDAQFVAPFVETANDGEHQPTFRNLTIDGTIYATHTQATDHDHVGGLIGHLFGTVTIEHCTSLVEIHYKGGAGGFVGLCEHSVSFNDCHSAAVIRSADGSNSGFVAWSRDSKWNISFTGCLFDGKLLQQNGSGSLNGGFIGWKGDAKTVNITNSLCAPAPLADGETMATDGSATFSREHSDHAATIKNSYYTAAFEIAQGKALHTVTAGTDVTVAHAGVATHYATSGITAYKATGASADSDPFIAGLLYNNNILYAGSDDQLSLTLTTSAQCDQPGYQYTYTASAGTLSGQTLTMPDDDVTISVALAPIDWATVNQGNSVDDPYMIYNKDQLLLLAHRVNGTNGETANDYKGKYFKLGADITFSHDAEEGDDYDENYEAIGGRVGSTYRYFKGEFDGANHTVSGIRIRKDGSGSADINQGLFGCIASGANIYDVHLTDARITGYYSVGGIAGYNNEGYISGCSVTDSYITALSLLYGTICGENLGTLTNNYYHGCTVNSTAVTSGMGCYGADITANNGALPAYRLALGANITTPPGTFADQTGWLDTPPVGARLAPENGFTLAGNHYFVSGYEFTPGSTLASGAAQGYTPRATLGGQLLDLYTPTGDADLLAGKAIARLTITADCDGKTLASTQAIYSTREPVTVAYIKADGTPGEASAIALDGHETVAKDGDIHLAAGTYYVGTDIAYANQIVHDGNITLILANGKTMTLNGNTTGIAIGYNLTIYGQSLDDATAGTLRYNGTWEGIHAYYYEQHSGNVSITTTGSGVFGINADVTLRGGTLTVTANGTDACAIYGYTHSILGGQLTATATGDGATGIYAGANDGTAITLGWTRPADRITASSISTGGGTVAVADGQALTDGSGHIYTGTLTASELSGFAAETTLQPCLALADAADNTAAITDHAGQTLAVALSGRTLYKDGSWNTLCLPFAVDLTDSGTLSGDNVQAMTLNTSSSTFADGTLTLNFTATETIPAGTPFIIKWDGDGSSNITNPVFEGVTVSNATNDATVEDVLTFTGTYAPVPIPADGDNTKLYLGSSNKLYYPTKAMTIGTHRAYFQLLGDLTAGEPTSPQQAGVRAFNLNFGDDEATGIISVHDSGFMVNGSDAWYTLDGRRLDGVPTAKGLYIHGGKKVAIK